MKICTTLMAIVLCILTVQSNAQGKLNTNDSRFTMNIEHEAVRDFDVLHDIKTAELASIDEYHQRSKAQPQFRFGAQRSNHQDPSHYAGNENIFTPFANRKATGNKVFIFDPRRLKWYAYNHSGRLVASGRASGGAHYCRDVGRPCRTPVGSFKVHHKGNAYCKSSKYPLGRGGAPMPHCMFFKGGYAIHGSPDVPRHNASHGCIRVLPSDARWLHGNFIDYGTTVIVKPY